MSETNDQTGKLLALEVLLRQANERAGNMAVELAAMTQSRDELAKWKSTEQRAMISMGKALIEAGCPCDGLPEGVIWAIEKAKTAEHERDALRREVEQVRRELGMDRAIDDAAKRLPEGWEILINVENGSGTVDLSPPYGDLISFDYGETSLSMQVRDAVEYAIKAAQTGKEDAE